jgi:hypothetical protein
MAGVSLGFEGGKGRRFPVLRSANALQAEAGPLMRPIAGATTNAGGVRIVMAFV